MTSSQDGAQPDAVWLRQQGAANVEARCEAAHDDVCARSSRTPTDHHNARRQDGHAKILTGSARCCPRRTRKTTRRITPTTPTTASSPRPMPWGRQRSTFTIPMVSIQPITDPLGNVSTRVYKPSRWTLYHRSAEHRTKHNQRRVRHKLPHLVHHRPGGFGCSLLTARPVSHLRTSMHAVTLPISPMTRSAMFRPPRTHLAGARKAFILNSEVELSGQRRLGGWKLRALGSSVDREFH